MSFGSTAVRLLHALLLGVAAAVYASELTLSAGVLAAGLGAFAGSLLAERLSARFRLLAILGLALVVFLAGAGLVGWLLDTPSFARALGAPAAMSAGEGLRWGIGALSAALALRAAALFYRAALALEGSAAVLVVATTVAAHRDGMIARPLEISDWFWRQGIDPVFAFLGVGLAAALLLAGVFASGRSGRRTLLQLLAVLLLGFWVMALLQVGRLGFSVARRGAAGAKLDKDQDGERDGRSGGSGTSEDGKHGKSEEDDALPPPPKQHGGQNRPTAIVVFQRDVAPLGDVFYFRHAAFSQFNGARLVEATTGGLDPDARYARLGAQEVPGVHRDGLGRARVATDVAVLSEHSRTFALIDAVRIEPRPNPEPARFRRAYRVISAVPTATVSLDAFLGLPPGDPSWDEATWAHYTELPHDERYHDLARRLQATLRPEYAQDPIALGFAVKQYLEEETIYSFRRKYVGDDPTAQFLFSEDKRGYCVHLAHAAAFLLRALGVPTRVSAGYAVPAQNLGRGSALLVKDGDAHAWAEIYLRGVGWIPLEVTPQRTDIEPTPFEEQDLQQLLGEMARKQGRFSREMPGKSPLVAALLTALGYLPWALLGLLGLSLLVKLWRILAPLMSREPAPRQAYRAALDLMSAVGWRRARGESREAFARRYGDEVPALFPLTHVVVASALGSRRPLDGAEGRGLGAWYRDALAEVKQSVPAWRFWLGLLNPVSWLWSR